MDGADSVIRKNLEPGEIILWCARPNPWVAMDQPLIAIVAAIGVGGISSLLLLVGWRGILAAFFLLCLCLIVVIRNVIALVNVWFAAYALTSRRLIVKAGLARPRSFMGEDITNVWSSSEFIGSLTIEYKPLPVNPAEPLPDVLRNARNRADYCTLLGISAPVMVATLIRKSLLARFPTTNGEAE